MNNTEIDRNNNSIVPLPGPTATSTNITMEMISGGTAVHDDGRVEQILIVHFTSGNGHHFYYPWGALKETVTKWMEIEAREIPPPPVVR